jgi:ABC-type polysaccharide/polyol phosphate transport system ATPase subunit
VFQPQKPKQPSEYAIIVENVTKHFRIPHEKKRTVFENIKGILDGGRFSYEEFRALMDVSFRVKPRIELTAEEKHINVSSL